MEDVQEDIIEQEQSNISGKPFNVPFRSTRLHIQRSNVCSRAYFVVVMVFFHVYILNVIALLLYVHYNNGPSDLVSEETSNGESSASVSGSRSSLPQTAPSTRELHVEDYSFSLHRIEGIRVGHVQQVSIVPDRTHEMRTLSLKPLLFEIPGFLSEEECRVVVQLAQLKGLMDSQSSMPSQEQEESNQPLLLLSSEEVFSLLDLNQDGFLQKEEILSHSRSQDGTWLSPESLRQILTGLEACPTGMLTLGDFRRVYDVSQRPRQQRSGKLHSHFKQRNRHTWLYQGPGSHHVLQTLRKRYLTVSFYLSSVEDGGEITFLVADNRTYDEQALVQDGVDLTDTQKTCGKGNLRMKPTTATALLWYNHLSDGRGWMGELDEFSLHGDCPVRRGVKWVANSWVNVDPDYQQQARYQRLIASQRHQAKAGMEDQYYSLSHNDLHLDL
uniref:Prolyl 4-hydroxylase, transmembrane (Endoplasmic reticulum) n=1 Tax=Iconisemion striatum TaxID=60296 RepID=A0A1A7WDV2_9TELE